MRAVFGLQVVKRVQVFILVDQLPGRFHFLDGRIDRISYVNPVFVHYRGVGPVQDQDAVIFNKGPDP